MPSTSTQVTLNGSLNPRPSEEFSLLGLHRLEKSDECCPGKRKKKSQKKTTRKTQGCKLGGGVDDQSQEKYLYETKEIQQAGVDA